MLRKIRIALATLFFVGITLLFMDITGALHAWLGWMAKLQFLPAVLAANFLVIIGLALLTLVFGRIYCSVICPLGVLQDIFSSASGRRKGKKMRFSYKKEHTVLRYVFFGVFVLALIFGIHAIVALLAPYSAYGRIAQTLFQPLWIAGNNLLAALSERLDSYAFYSREVWLRGLPNPHPCLCPCMEGWKNLL